MATPEPRPGPTQRVGPGDPHAGGFGELPQAAGGSVPVHPHAAAVEQDRPAGASADRAIDGSPHRWRQGDQDDLAAFAADAQHPVAVFFAQVGDVRAGGFEDSQAEQSQHRHQGEITGMGGLPGCGEQGLELAGG